MKELTIGFLAAVSTALALLAGCGPVRLAPRPPVIAPTRSDAVRRGIAAYRAGDYQQAAVRLQAALAEQLSDGDRQQVLLVLAKSYFALGRTTDAATTLAKVDAQATLPAQQGRERYELAYLVAHTIHGCAAAERVTPPPLGKTPVLGDGKLFRRQLMIAARCRLELRRWQTALETLEQIPPAFENKAPIINEWVLQQIRVIATQRVSFADARALLKEKWVVYGRSFLALRVVRVLLRRGEHALARSLLSEIRPDHLPPQDRALLQDISRLLKEPVSDKSGPPRVVVLLPLSGAWSELGRQLRDGILFAARVFDTGSGTLQYFVRDTRGNAALARRHFLAAAQDKHVVAIIGPLGPHAATGLSSLARRFGLPTFAFTPRALDSGKLWQSLFTEADENVQRLVGHVVKRVKAPRCVVVRTVKRFDLQRAARFRAALGKLGGAVASEIVFDGKPDFVRKLKTIRQLRANCLYLPLATKDAALVLRYLASQDIWAASAKQKLTLRGKQRQLVILGGSTWSAAQFVEDNHRYLQGVVIPTPFAPLASTAAKQFHAGFNKLFGRAPSVLAALGATAVSLLELQQDKAFDRKRLAERLRASKDFSSLPLRLGRDPLGRLHVIPYLSTVSGTGLVSLP